MRGLVLKSTGSFYKVLVNDTLMECTLGGRLRLADLKHSNPVAVGDWVEITEEGLIIDTEQRRNYLIRKATRADKQTHIVAANLDLVLVLATFRSPRTSTGFIDRVVTTAVAYDIPVVVVFNKKDLMTEEEKDEVEYYREVYTDAGFDFFVISATDETDVAGIRSMLENKVTLITGHSGVGKSTLLNAINPGLEVRTGDISRKHDKGMHTTTFAEMHALENGGFVIDTPGIKEFGMHDVDKYTLGDYFPEIFRIKSQCRFSDCLHVNEPGCAIVEAVENDEIAVFRYQNYLNIMDSLEED